MRAIYVVLLTAFVMLAPPGSASGSESPERAEAVAVGAVVEAVVSAEATPSPTLGSTPQRGTDLPGSADGDSQDFEKTYLAVVSFLFLAFLVGSSVLFYLWRRSRKTREILRERHLTRTE
jgi:hypothetical protein